MTTYYARTAGGNANVAATWSLTSGGGAAGAAPGTNDDVILDANSGAVTWTASVTYNSLDALASAGVMTINTAVTLSIKTFAKFPNLSSGVVMSGSALIDLIATTDNGGAGWDVALSGRSFTASGLRFSGVGGRWKITSAPGGTSSTLSWTSGGLDLNGFTLPLGSMSISGAGAKEMVGTAGVVNVYASSTTAFNSTASVTWTTGLAIRIIVAAGGLTTTVDMASNVSFTNSTSGSASITLTNAAFNGTVTSSTSLTIITTGTATLGSLDMSAATVKTLTLNGDLTISTAFSFSGQSSVSRAVIISSTNGTRRTLTMNCTPTFAYVDIADVNGAGSFGWDLSAITGNSGDWGNNNGITFTAPMDCYWVGGTGSWSSGTTRWSSTSGGAANTARVPLVQDTAIFDNNSFTANSQAVTMDVSSASYPSIDASAFNNRTGCSIAQGSSSSRVIRGTTINLGGLGHTASGGASALTWAPRAAGSLTTNGKTMMGSSSQSNLVFDLSRASITVQDALSTGSGTGGVTVQGNVPANTVTFLASLTVNGALTLSGGTCTISNGASVTIASFISSVTTTRTLNMGTGTWTVTSSSGTPWAPSSSNLTINGSSATLQFTATGSSALVFNLGFGGTHTYGTVILPSAHTGTKTIGSSSPSTTTAPIIGTLQWDTTPVVPLTVNWSSGAFYNLGTMLLNGAVGAVVSHTSGSYYFWNLTNSWVASYAGFSWLYAYGPSGVPITADPANGSVDNGANTGVMFGPAGTMYFTTIAGNQTTSGTILNATRNPGMKVGDLLIASVLAGNTGFTMSTPAGWTKVPQVSGTSDTHALYWKWATSADVIAASFSFGTWASAPAVSNLISVANVDPTTPFVPIGTDSGSVNVTAAPSITTTVNNAMVIFFGNTRLAAGSAAMTTPTGFNYIASNLGATGPSVRNIIASKFQAVAGATGDVAPATNTGLQASNIMGLLALKPASTKVQRVLVGTAIK